MFKMASHQTYFKDYFYYSSNGVVYVSMNSKNGIYAN